VVVVLASEHQPDRMQELKVFFSQSHGIRSSPTRHMEVRADVPGGGTGAGRSELIATLTQAQIKRAASRTSIRATPILGFGGLSG